MLSSSSAFPGGQQLQGGGLGLLSPDRQGVGSAPQLKRQKKEVFHSGTVLSPAWAKQFILGHVLQVYQYDGAEDGPTYLDFNGGEPRDSSSARGGQSASSSANKKVPYKTGGRKGTANNKAGLHGAELDSKMVELQKALSERWKMAIEPLTAQDTREIQKSLTRYVIGGNGIPVETFQVLNDSIGTPLQIGDLMDPRNMYVLLRRLGFIKRANDNLHRLAAKATLKHDAETESIVHEYIDRADPYDVLREDITENIYAIDSATTSEVDDAIGLRVDENGVEWFTVYVSDATTNCPFNSKLEIMSARHMATTSYLPEGVFFMLPKPIIEAATLRIDRKCRTFNINFRIDEATGALCDMSISLGWAHRLRRITYDAVQELYDTKSKVPLGSTPEWCKNEDIAKIHRIYAVALHRLASRRKRMTEKYGAAIDSDLPDPLITVKGTSVESVKDQIISTKDARVAVAELMIAANEVCSKLAQQYKLSIPYRGTRPLSTDHEVANLRALGFGVSVTSGRMGLPSPAERAAHAEMELTNERFATKLFDSLSSLMGVTRAIYHHEPLFHIGLDTTDYTHSTSPLRRYPDMLVHHQHKVHLAAQHGHKFEEFIPAFQMAELCADASKKQEAEALLQDNSAAYWLYRFVYDSIVNRNAFSDDPSSDSTPLAVSEMLCLCGRTRYLGSSPEDFRGINGFRNATMTVTRPGASARSQSHQERMDAILRDSTYVSDVYIPRLQMIHTMYHNDPDLSVGNAVKCRVELCDPMLGNLIVRPIGVVSKEQSDALAAALMIPSTLTSS